MWHNWALALMLFLAPPPPIAYWSSSISVTIRWEQQSRACLYREPAIGASVFIGCYDGSGRAVVRLGGSQTDGAYRPRVGDVYRIVIDGVVWRVALRGAVRLPLIRAGATPLRRVRLPLVRA